MSKFNEPSFSRRPHGNCFTMATVSSRRCMWRCRRVRRRSICDGGRRVPCCPRKAACALQHQPPAVCPSRAWRTALCQSRNATPDEALAHLEAAVEHRFARCAPLGLLWRHDVLSAGGADLLHAEIDAVGHCAALFGGLELSRALVKLVKEGLGVHHRLHRCSLALAGGRGYRTR